MLASQQLTPTEAAAHARRKAFRQSIAARAVPDRGISVKDARPAPELPTPSEVQDWRERQMALHTPRKPLWFSIVGEINLRPPSIAEIQEAVAAYFHVRRSDIISEKRCAEIMIPRFVACYLARTLTPFGLPTIGKYFGGRDHTTIRSAVLRIEAMLLTNQKLASDIAVIKINIGQRRETNSDSFDRLSPEVAGATPSGRASPLSRQPGAALQRPAQ